MPTIAFFYGIVIQMYWNDHNPPHIHAEYAGFSAAFDIRTGLLMQGRMPRQGTRIISDWIAEHRDALLANWERARNLQPLEQIVGVDDDE